MANLKFALLVILILAFYYQPIAGRCPSCPEECCYHFRKGNALPLRKISFYRRTTNGCSMDGVVLGMKSGKKVCVKPGDSWVQNAMAKLPRK